MSDLRVTVSRHAGVPQLELAGELDISSVAEAERAIETVEAQRPSMIVVDLRNLSFIDSTGIRFVIRVQARAETEGRGLALVRGRDQVQRVFRLAQLESRFRFVDGPEEIGDAGA